jgi:hypothetical protein
VPGKTVLTRFLKELAGTLSDRIGDDGRVVTKAEALALVIWERAIGYTETDDDGGKVAHKPEPWAVALVYERLEGRCPTAQDVGTNKGTVGERISELSKIKINALSVVSEPTEEDDPDLGEQHAG